MCMYVRILFEASRITEPRVSLAPHLTISLLARHLDCISEIGSPPKVPSHFPRMSLARPAHLPCISPARPLARPLWHVFLIACPHACPLPPLPDSRHIYPSPSHQERVPTCCPSHWYRRSLTMAMHHRMGTLTLTLLTAMRLWLYRRRGRCQNIHGGGCSLEFVCCCLSAARTFL